MRLFLAEKPSVGREISKYLPGKRENHDGYISHGEDVVTWAFGHMLRQAAPDDYDEKYIRWNANDLPIVPEEWKLLITESSAKQFAIIKRLLERCDSVVHAGDPDREGQLLIDEILVYLGIDKPVERILINALDEKSMKDALGDLRDNKDFYNLRQSALARARADWLVGMNLSRAYTIAARRQGHKVTFPIGRVKTPTLALVVRREEELATFQPVEYYTIEGTYAHENGLFKANWKPKDMQRGLDSEDRLLDKSIAETLVEELLNSPEAVVVDREKKKKKDLQRLPLSLSALQVLAGKAYGYDPQEVLDGAQSLYEKKLTTYPRSDCEYLPSSQFKDSRTIINNLAHISNDKVAQWAKGADLTIKSKAWNDKKITAHHAIIPTTVACPFDKLTCKEQALYEIISQAYIAQFYPVHEYEQTRIVLDHKGETFVANGRVVIEPGWKILYKKAEGTQRDENHGDGEDDVSSDSVGSGKEGQDRDDNYKDSFNLDESNELPMMNKGDALLGQSFDIQDKTTKPPSRFTTATLLQAMKEIHKYVKNDDVKKQLKDVSGIGTEATRAQIIKDLIDRQFMEEHGKKKILKPTENAYKLIHSLPDELSYPDATAIWEERLARMSRGDDSLDAFVKDQVDFLSGLVVKAIGPSLADVGPVPKNGLPCPICGKGTLQLRQGKFGLFMGCTNYPECKHTEPVEAQSLSNRNKSYEERPISILVKEEDKKYKCPRCKEGYFVRVEGRRGWQCSNVSQCRTQCADVDGKPSFYKDRQ